MVMKNKKKVLAIAAVTILLMLSGCASLDDIFQKPTASIDSVEIAGINFESAELLVNVEVDNPNPLGLSLSAYDYGVEAWGSSVVSGRQEDGMSLRARGKSLIKVPVKMKFADMFHLGKSALNADSVPLKFNIGIEIAIPYLPGVRLDLQSETDLPVPKPPVILPKSIRVKSINLTGAEIIMDFEVSNPNIFSLDINSLKGMLEVSGNEWGRIGISNSVNLAKKGRKTVRAGLNLSFLSVGRSALQLLTGSGKANVNLDGDMDIDVDIPGFNGKGIPWNADANVSIIR